MEFVQAKILDSTHLELARPIAGGPGGRVVVMVTDSRDADAARLEWLAGSEQSLRSAYGDSEPEYFPAMVRETNPDYGG